MRRPPASPRSRTSIAAHPAHPTGLAAAVTLAAAAISLLLPGLANAAPGVATATASQTHQATTEHQKTRVTKGGAGPTQPPASAQPTAPGTPQPASSATAMPSVAPTTRPSTTPSPTTSPTATPSATVVPTAKPTPTASAGGTAAFEVSVLGSDANPGTLTAPWRTISHAVLVAPAGSTIQVGTGTYGSFSVLRSHLVIEAQAGAIPTVAGGSSAIVIEAADITLRGLTVTGATNQGIWVDGSSGVLLDHLMVTGNLGHGAQIIRSTNVQVTGSSFVGNRVGGLRELDGTSGGRYVGNVITDNGHDGLAYNGDGMLLQGSGAYVADNIILRNGDNTTYEHGIYAAAIASGYLIEHNTLAGNAASGIKASGSGIVRGNSISGSVRGIVFADTGGPVTVTDNTISATTYAILVTSNCDLARYRSDDNTFLLKVFGLGGPIDLATWRLRTGLDEHSS